MEIRDAIDGDLLNVYYESGHTFSEFQINVENQSASPFTNFDFVDFSPYKITAEKPGVRGDQRIHDAIGGEDDSSLFAWVVANYNKGWLICDDGAGELADFVHLLDGTLTAIHVKRAHSAETTRRVRVTAYQEVIAQAVKNLRLLDRQTLVDRFVVPRIARPAAWLNGVRMADRSGFVDALRARTAVNKTYVTIVQPHLQRAVHDAARVAAEMNTPTADPRSLALLDGLLRTARKAVISKWDDLVVIGSV